MRRRTRRSRASIDGELDLGTGERDRRRDDVDAARTWRANDELDEVDVVRRRRRRPIPFRARPVDPESARGIALGVEIDDEDAITGNAPAHSRGSPPSWSCRRRPSGSRRRSSGPLSDLLGGLSRGFQFYHRGGVPPRRAGRSLGGCQRRLHGGVAIGRSHGHALTGRGRRLFHVKHGGLAPARGRAMVAFRGRVAGPFGSLPVLGHPWDTPRQTSPPDRSSRGAGQGGRATFGRFAEEFDPSHDLAARCGRRGGDGPARTERWAVPADR